MGGRQMSGGSQPKITNLEDLISAGEKAFNSGQVDQARACFEAALESNPGHAVGLNNLAVLCHHSGDLEQAELLFLRAAALAQNPADALLNPLGDRMAAGQHSRVYRIPRADSRTRG